MLQNVIAIHSRSSMTIRKKTLLVFFSIMATIAGALVLFSQTVLLNKFNVIEKNQVASDLNKVNSSINIALDDLTSTATDYAVWDATYQFVVDHNQDFITANITESNFANLNLYLWIITDSNGNVLYAKEYFSNQLVEVAPVFIKTLTDNGLLGKNSQEKHGILLIRGQPLLIASKAVTNSDETLPANGMMVVARLLDNAYLKDINKSIEFPTTVALFSDLSKDPVMAKRIGSLSAEHPDVVQTVNDNTNSGYSLVSDINGQPVAVVTIDVPRDIFHEGRSTIYLFIGIIAGIGWIGAFLLVWLNNKILFEPLKKLRNVSTDLSLGNFSISIPSTQKDEIGDIYRSFLSLISFLKNIEGASRSISDGDLTVQLSTQSEKDDLSLSIIDMVKSLREKVNLFSENSNKVEKAADGLSLSSKDANNSTSQIATTITQVAHGITEQTTSVNKTASAVDQLVKAIDGVARGAEAQSSAVESASSITQKIADTIRGVNTNIKSVADESNKAAINAEQGSQIVADTLTGMQTIKKNMDISSEKIHQMGDRSEQIADIVETIDDIASQTNLLALNAAIEAARAESQSKQLVEVVLNRQMLSQASLVNQVLVDNLDRPTEFWVGLAKTAGMDIVSITNEDGVNILSSDPNLIGFRYSENPKEQSYVFRQLLGKKNGSVCQPPRKRNIDNKTYKYVGISRSDGKGIIQVGFNSDSLTAFQFQVGGFAVVANEVYRLAENARVSAKSISILIKEIGISVNEAVNAMEESSKDVANGYALADKSNSSLGTILQAAKAVSEQAELAAYAGQQMDELTSELVKSVNAVSSVIEENIEATTQMAKSSNEVSEAVESFASVSEENSAAVEEVSASTEEMKAQVEMVSIAAVELREMAQSLHSVIQSFRLH